MSTATAIRPGGPANHPHVVRGDRPAVPDQLQALWAMTVAERVEAMWRGHLTLRQLCKWTSRAAHEVPLLGSEFAWIVMRMPEWAEADQPASTSAAKTGQQRTDRS